MNFKKTISSVMVLALFTSSLPSSYGAMGSKFGFWQGNDSQISAQSQTSKSPSHLPSKKPSFLPSLKTLGKAIKTAAVAAVAMNSMDGVHGQTVDTCLPHLPEGHGTMECTHTFWNVDNLNFLKDTAIPVYFNNGGSSVDLATVVYPELTENYPYILAETGEGEFQKLCFEDKIGQNSLWSNGPTNPMTGKEFAQTFKEAFLSKDIQVEELTEAFTHKGSLGEVPKETTQAPFAEANSSKQQGKDRFYNIVKNGVPGSHRKAGLTEESRGWKLQEGEKLGYESEEGLRAFGDKLGDSFHAVRGGVEKGLHVFGDKLIDGLYVFGNKLGEGRTKIKASLGAIDVKKHLLDTALTTGAGAAVAWAAKSLTNWLNRDKQKPSEPNEAYYKSRSNKGDKINRVIYKKTLDSLIASLSSQR